MVSRRATLEQQRPGDALSGARELAGELDQSDLWRGRFLEVPFAAASSATVAHGLGRRFKGSFVVGQQGGTFVAIPIKPGVGSADPATHLTVYTYDWAGAPLNVTTTLNLWVF